MSMHSHQAGDAARVTRRIRTVETRELEIGNLSVIFQKTETRDFTKEAVASIAGIKTLWTAHVETLPGLKPIGATFEACLRDAEQQIADYWAAWNREGRDRNYEEIYTVGAAIYGNLWTTLINRVMGISNSLLPSSAFSRAYKRAMATCCLGILSHIY